MIKISRGILELFNKNEDKKVNKKPKKILIINFL